MVPVLGSWSRHVSDVCQIRIEECSILNTADMCDLQVAGGGAGEGLAVPGLVAGEGAGVGGRLGLDVSAHCSDVETSPPHHLPRSASVSLDTLIQIFNEDASFGFQVSTF